MITRRHFVFGAAIALAGPALAQHTGHDPLYSGLRDPKLTDIPRDTTARQWVFESPAPKADDPGRWMARAPLPLPRSEMAWATALRIPSASVRAACSLANKAARSVSAWFQAGR